MTQFATFVVGGALLVGLCCLLLPPRLYRLASAWVSAQKETRYRKWLSYDTVKWTFSASRLAMNAIMCEGFSKSDLEALNNLFLRLALPPAVPIEPIRGDPYDPTVMSNVGKREPLQALRKASYVLGVDAIGVRWRGEVLAKAKVRTCTYDVIMVSRMVDMQPSEDKAVASFVEYLQSLAGDRADFELEPAAIEGYLDSNGAYSSMPALFHLLRKCGPEHGFELTTPVPESPFDGDAMRPYGGRQVGQRETVSAVVHPGMRRHGEPQWRMRALVKLKSP
jgi:hypothetical protein